MAIEIISEPASEPVTLQEAKDFLRVTVLDDDAIIASLIVAARKQAETFTRRQFVTASLRLSMDEFPWAGPGRRFYHLDRPGGGIPINDSGIVLPRPPAIAVSSITYVDTAGVTQTLAPSAYQVDARSTPARILPAYGTFWPVARYQPNAVTVLYTAGYGAASAVPEGIKTYVKMRVAQLYDNRGNAEDAALDMLLDPYRWGGYVSTEEHISHTHRF